MDLIREIEKEKNPSIKRVAEYLLERIEIDSYLKEKIEASSKDLKKCFDYITSQAKKKAKDGCAMIPDQDVFDWAVHFYLEDEPEPEEDATEELEERIEKAKTVTPKKEEKKKPEFQQATLFDFL